MRGPVTLGVICFLALSIVSVNSDIVRPCDLSDIECIRTTFANLLGFNPVKGNGRDYNTDYLTLNVTVPYFNGTVIVTKCLYSGFSSAVIQDFFFQDDEYTVLTVNIPLLVLEADFWVKRYFPNQAPITITTFGQFVFENATATVTYPGVTNLKVFESRPFIYLAGGFVSGITDYAETIATNPVLYPAGLELLENINLFYTEALVDIGIRIPWQYALANIVQSDDYIAESIDAVPTA